MPIDTPKKEYSQHLPQWKKCGHVYAGSDAVKMAGEDYLPKMSGMTPKRYEAYKMAALFYGATKRTINAVIGAVMRKDPQRTLPSIVEKHQTDITLSGISLEKFERWLLEQEMVKGRCGILASWSEEKKRPYLCGYTAESIIYWNMMQMGDVWVTGEVRLVELETRPDPKDPFKDVDVPVIRRMFLDEKGLLVVQMYEQQQNEEGTRSKTEWIQVGEDELPERRGKRLNFIPFVPMSARGTGWEICEPPFMDLAEVNLDHYRLDALHKKGLAKCALPQLWLAGFQFAETDDSEEGGYDPDEFGLEADEALTKKVPVGSDYALVSDNPQATAGYAEVTGAGMEFLEREKEKNENRMAALGARVLETQKAGVEAAHAIQMRHSGETVTISDLVLSVEMAEMMALSMFAWWADTKPEPEYNDKELNVKFNRDFVSTSVDHNLLREMMKGVQSGEIDSLTWYEFLEKGELTRDGDTYDDFKNRLAEEGARMPVGA